MLFGKKKDKKKKKVPTERFLSLKANDVQVDAINFSLTKDKEGNPRLEVRTRDVCEALHYSHIDFELKTSVLYGILQKLIVQFSQTFQAKYINNTREKQFPSGIFIYL